MPSSQLHSLFPIFVFDMCVLFSLCQYVLCFRCVCCVFGMCAVFSVCDYVYCVFDMCAVFSLCVCCAFGMCIVFSICVLCFRCVCFVFAVCVVFSICVLCFSLMGHRNIYIYINSTRDWIRLHFA